MVVEHLGACSVLHGAFRSVLAYKLGCHVQSQKIRRKLKEWADDISCAVFGLAGAVTIMYHVLEVILCPALQFARALH